MKAPRPRTTGPATSEQKPQGDRDSYRRAGWSFIFKAVLLIFCRWLCRQEGHWVWLQARIRKISFQILFAYARQHGGYAAAGRGGPRGRGTSA